MNNVPQPQTEKAPWDTPSPHLKTDDDGNSQGLKDY